MDDRIFEVGDTKYSLKQQEDLSVWLICEWDGELLLVFTPMGYSGRGYTVNALSGRLGWVELVLSWTYIRSPLMSRIEIAATTLPEVLEAVSRIEIGRLFTSESSHAG